MKKRKREGERERERKRERFSFFREKKGVSSEGIKSGRRKDIKYKT